MGATEALKNNDAENICALFDDLYQLEVFRLGEFYLRSGQMTPIYVDLRRIISRPKTLRLAAERICDIIRSKDLQFDYIVGVPFAALPLATVVADILDIPMLLKRKEVKSYGTKQSIEGIYEKGKRALLIEDVVVHGDSIKETTEGLREEGLEVVDAISILDRDQGARASLADINITFHSVLTMDDILNGLIVKGDMTSERKKDIIEHLHKPFTHA